MNVYIEISQMPVVQKILADTALKIAQITGKKVRLYIHNGFDSPITHRQLVKDKLKQLICNEFDVHWEPVISKKRHKYLVDARHAYM
jgi:chromosomal replication initiation ATPase DnaA